MTAELPASLARALLGTTLGALGQDGSDRVSLEGLTFGRQPDGALELGIRRLQAASLRLAGAPPAAGAAPAAAHDRATWSLGPLETANGTIRARITDAHLLFDADVTVPIREGEIPFNDATVEHVGPDSHMGVSRLGLYVDAPNGRSYLYRFPSAPVAGVTYEQRGPLPGPWASERGTLRLQPFGESLLQRDGGGQDPGFTAQARLLFDRTAVSGEVRLGDGRFVAPGVQAEFVGRAEGRNTVRLHSEAVGRGFAVDIADLAVRNALWRLDGTQLACDEVSGALVLRLSVDDARLRFAFDLASVTATGVRVRLQR